MSVRIVAARIVAVHGIGNYRAVPPVQAAAELAAVLTQALDRGVRRAGGAPLPDAGPADLRVAYYAHLLRDSGRQAAWSGDELTEAEQTILDQWAIAFGVPAEVAQGRPALPLRLVAEWLADRIDSAPDPALRRRVSRFLAGFVRDVAAYLDSPDRRTAVREETARIIAEHRPHIVVAHSLGSVVAYETLWTRPDLPVPLLITVGSPLALPGAIFDRLLPAPHPNARDGRGSRPPAVARWVNVADHGDVIAIPRPLHRRFDGLDASADHETSIGSVAMHGFGPYLACAPTIRAITGHLSEFGDPLG